MKLPEKEKQEIILGTAKESMFSIDSSNSVIFEILRDKMYSNKIGAVAREVASNSRDANREAKTDKDIEIEFTNDNFMSAIGDTSIIFRDFGVGISPDRMENVFLKYAASTKRDSNTQTGGFGLGAKTPFAYTDSFVVKTTCDYAYPIFETQMVEEDVINEYSGEVIGTKNVPRSVIVGHEPIKRLEFVYNAIIDSTGKGKMITISEEETTQETGTQIIIPILSNDDRYKFEKEVYKSTMHWNGISYINFKTNKPEANYILEEKDFKISNYSQSNFIGLLDGIPYEIKPENSEALVGYTVYLELNLEKLTINANRESLQYDEQTINHVNEVYKIFKDNLIEKAKTYLADNDSFLGAHEKLKRLKATWLNDDTILDQIIRSLRNSSFGNIDYDVLFKGEKIEKISAPNHSILFVKWLGTASKYTNSSLSLDYPIVYLDKGGIKVPKNEKLDKFYLIKPDKSKPKDIIEAERKYLEDLGIELTNYSDVKPDKAYVKPVKNDKVKLYLRDISNPHRGKYERYFDKTLKTIVGTNVDEVFFIPISDFRSHYNFRSLLTPDNLRILRYKKQYKNIFYVNENAFRKYLEPNGYKKLSDVYKTIDLSEFTKYVEMERIRTTVGRISPIVRENFPEMLPLSIVKFMGQSREEIPPLLRDVSWRNLGMKASKFDYDGVIKKYEDKLHLNYPLLPAYINYSGITKEEKVKNIKKYIELTKK